MSFINYFHIDIFFGWRGLPGQQQAEDTALWCLVSELMTCTAVKTSRGVEVHRKQLDNTPLLRTGRSLEPHTSHLADINNDMTGKRILTYTNFLGSSHIPHYTKYSIFSMWQKARLLIKKDFLNFLWEWFSHSSSKQNMDSFIHFYCI